MTSHGFDITVTSESVDVSRDPKPTTRARFSGALFVLLAPIVVLCALVFLPGKHGSPAMWADLSSKPVTSSDFLFPFCIVLSFVIFMSWLGIRWSLAAWPTDDALHCDRNTFTVSRAKWLDTQNKLIPESYPLAQISELRYSAIATAKGSTIYGLRFRLNGKKQKLLSELEAPEAKVILNALKALGADVPDDPKLDKRIKETLAMQDGDTSWMDRNWMDPDKQ